MKLNYLILLIPALAVFFAWQNNDIEISRHNYTNDKLPKSFVGFRILHVSDFHNKNFHGSSLSHLLSHYNGLITCVTVPKSYPYSLNCFIIVCRH